MNAAQRFVLHGSICLLVLASACTRLSSAPKNESGRADASLKYAVDRLGSSIRMLGDPLKPPVSAKPDSAWRTGGIYDWRSGFFSGCLWYAYEFTRDDSFKAE